MASYDSDQESIDMDDLPDYGVHVGNTGENSQMSAMGLESLINLESADKQTVEKMEQIERELELFTLDITEGSKLPFEPVVERYIELQPPSIPFFTSDHHHLYSADMLMWPFPETDHPLFIQPDSVKKHILDGYFERQYLSKKKLTRLLQYLFHLMSSTTDCDLMDCILRTMCYIVSANALNVNILDDIFLALANLGGDISKFGKDVSQLSMPVALNPIDNRQEKPLGIFKENKILMIEFLNAHFSKSKIYTSEELEDLLKIYLAVGLDPQILDSGITIHISNGISQILNIFPSDKEYNERLLNMVKFIVEYCDSHHHTVAYVCVNYISPIHKRGQMLRSAVAYLQASISLQSQEEECVLHNISPEDVLELVSEQIHKFSDETESYILLSIMILIDACISDDPIPADHRGKLQELIQLLESTLKRRRRDIDDQNTLHLGHVTDRLMIKWKQKAGHVKRQQTLMELRANQSFSSQLDNSMSSG